MSTPFEDGQDDDRIFLILAAAERLKQKNADIIQEITGQGYMVIVITTNQPSTILRRTYVQNGIPNRHHGVGNAVPHGKLRRLPVGVQQFAEEGGVHNPLVRSAADIPDKHTYPSAACA